MRYQKVGRWVNAVPAVVVLAAVLIGEGVFLNENPGGNLLRSHSALRAMFHIPMFHIPK
jgi:hypothetical protein